MQHGIDLLNGRNDQPFIIFRETADQFFRIVRLININDIIGCIREKARSRLIIELSAVYDKDCFLNRWDLQEIPSHLIGSQCLPRARRVPDIARLLTHGGFSDGFNSMHLIRPQ